VINKTDNNTMRLSGDYFTVQEMSSILGESKNTVKKRILRLDIKAIVKNALYTRADFNKIKNVSMGRPKKSETKTISKAKPAKQKK
jgi:predicted ArsR family transcriptional regulator